MSKFSDLYPLTGGGGSANIAGFTWQEKTADFTAESNQAYYCDTALGDILLTLPASPAPGDEVAFLILGANALNITTTDNIKSAPLDTDFVRQVTENYLMVVLFYENNTVGWNWDARYNSVVISAYIGTGLALYFQSLNDTNGVIHYYGTNGNTAAFTNPVTSAAISAAALGTSGLSGGTVANFFDRSTTNQYLFINGNSSNRARLEIYIPGSLRLDDIVIKAASDPTTLKTFNVKGWNFPDTYANSTTLLSVVDESAIPPNSFKRYVVNSLSFYKNFALEVISATNNDGYLRLAEIELYGLLIP